MGGVRASKHKKQVEGENLPPADDAVGGDPLQDDEKEEEEEEEDVVGGAYSLNLASIQMLSFYFRVEPF